MQLSQYVKDTQALTRDSLGLLTSTAQVQRWVNEARRQTAYATGCLNLLATGMSPYGNSANPGTMVPGAFTPGSAPVTTFQTIPNTEMYPFSIATAQIKSAYAGIDYVTDVTSVAVSWGSMRPALDWMAWEDLQAYARSYNYLVTSYPLVWSTNGDGANANLWMWPVPSQALEMEWQCTCSPAALYTDSDYDAIPHPFQNCIKYKAAALCFLGTNRGLVQLYEGMWQQAMVRARGATDHGRVAEWYSQS